VEGRPDILSLVGIFTVNRRNTAIITILMKGFVVSFVCHFSLFVQTGIQIPPWELIAFSELLE
jgi:hypothetical protein